MISTHETYNQEINYLKQKCNSAQSLVTVFRKRYVFTITMVTIMFSMVKTAKTVPSQSLSFY